MDLILDVNTWIFPMDLGKVFRFLLVMNALRERLRNNDPLFIRPGRRQVPPRASYDVAGRWQLRRGRVGAAGTGSVSSRRLRIRHVWQGLPHRRRRRIHFGTFFQAVSHYATSFPFFLLLYYVRGQAMITIGKKNNECFQSRTGNHAAFACSWHCVSGEHSWWYLSP